MFPSSPKINKLKVVSTTAEDTSIMKVEDPRLRMSLIAGRVNLCFKIAGRDFFFAKWIERMPRLMIGAKLVAKAAPNIPIFSGKRNM